MFHRQHCSLRRRLIYLVVQSILTTGVPPTFNEKLGLNLMLNFKLVLMNFYVPILSRLLHHTCSITERHAQ